MQQSALIRLKAKAKDAEEANEEVEVVVMVNYQLQQRT